MEAVYSIHAFWTLTVGTSALCTVTLNQTIAEDELPRWEGQFRILALDGGGIRGLFSAAVLAFLEQDLDIRITDHFDLITGTSTGGIIAIGLGLGMRPKELVKFYTGKGPGIFPASKWRWGRYRRFIRWLRRHKYDSGPLEKSIQEAIGERSFGSSAKRLVIPSFDLGHDEVRVFRTPHHPRLRRDWRIPAWKITSPTACYAAKRRRRFTPKPSVALAHAG